MKVGFCTKIQTASVIQTKKEQRGAIAKSNTGQKRSVGGLASGRAAVYEKSSMSQEMRQKMKELEQAPKKEADRKRRHMVTDTSNSYLNTLKKSERKRAEKAKKPVKYNYKDVANKIRQAKTSISAGQAVLAARRKVLEIRRKISSHSEDAEELQLALTHAKRMEMVARKKKHNLELEELVVHTRKRDEMQDKVEEAGETIKDVFISENEEELVEQEDGIFEERKEILEEISEELTKSGNENAGEILDELNEVVAEFGEEELKQLEEAMEMLENMEIVDPHMSEEELEELKRKHRAAENKAIVKAEMDYLKGLSGGGGAEVSMETAFGEGIDIQV